MDVNKHNIERYSFFYYYFPNDTFRQFVQPWSGTGYRYIKVKCATADIALTINLIQHIECYEYYTL